MTRDRLLEDIVLAMLAVNQYPLTKVYPLRDALKAKGWLDPDLVTTWSHEEAVANLVAAGYDRGSGYNTRLADRLQEFALFQKEKGLERLEEAIRTNDRENAEKELLAIYGVGPAVVRNFWWLQDEA